MTTEDAELILIRLTRQTVENNPWRRGYRWIYGIQTQHPNIDEQPIKIGIANSVLNRLIGLQSAHPYPLKLIAYFPAVRGLETEQWIHSLFEDVRLCGEWFRPDDVVLAFLNEQHLRFQATVEQCHIPPRYKKKAETAKQEADRIAEIERLAWDKFSERRLCIESIRVHDGDDLIEPEPVPAIPAAGPSWEELLRERWSQSPSLLDPDELALITRIAAPRLRSLARKGRIPAVRLSTHTIRWTPDQAIASITALGLDGSSLYLPDSNVQA